MKGAGNLGIPCHWKPHRHDPVGALSSSVSTRWQSGPAGYPGFVSAQLAGLPCSTDRLHPREAILEICAPDPADRLHLLMFCFVRNIPCTDSLGFSMAGWAIPVNVPSQIFADLIYSGLAVVVVLIFGPKILMRYKPIYRDEGITNIASPKTGD